MNVRALSGYLWAKVRARDLPHDGPGTSVVETKSVLLAAGVLLTSIGIVFRELWFLDLNQVLSAPGADVDQQFFAWREFAFDQWRSGNFPLWNPQLYGGLPFFGGMQSALLYPLNWLHLLLPTALAINLSFLIHVFLVGMFTFLWLAWRQQSRTASIAGALVMAYSGAFFLHIFAGHVSNIEAMVWVPLILAAIDGLCDRPGLSWMLLGTFAIAMQVLAGHPQYVYYSSIGLGLYALVRFAQGALSWRSVLALAAVGPLAMSMVAAQLFPAFEAALEGSRSGGLSLSAAGHYSLPPENLLSLVAPEYLSGGPPSLHRWRYLFWEITPFFGVSTLLLSSVGALSLTSGRHRHWALGFSAAVMIILALGSNTPLFPVLHRWLPGFDKFRGTSKFSFFAVLFAVGLACRGLDLLRTHGSVARRLVYHSLALGLVLALLGGSLLYSSTDTQGVWHRVLSAVEARSDRHRNLEANETAILRRAGTEVLKGSAVSFGVMALTSFGGSAVVVPSLALAAIVEVIAFVAPYVTTFDAQRLDESDLGSYVAKEFPEARGFRLNGPVVGAMTGGPADIGGYDHFVTKRYAELLAAWNGQNPDTASYDVQLRRVAKWLGMLRLGFLVDYKMDGQVEVRPLDVKPLRRFQFVQQFSLVSSREEAMQQIFSDSFDPRRSVVLEQVPSLVPEQTADLSTVNPRIVDEDTDQVTLDFSIPANALLLVTDSFSRGWRVTPLPGSAQQEYTILPANYALRAIPLRAGEHRFRMEYWPGGLTAGLITSTAGWTLFIACMALWIRSRATATRSYDERHARA